ncbi:MotA/TolQ/ExbB proton channel family protein [Guyparkeria halophila]|uniref:MotA/TolQ/ExbB proton channel family protein n=1 Tax=Guyparkeria halophila TaxID=47960 RepID=A0ABZ0YTI7_9GAMM|nr:MotA/TolQ/ExbB proton channel family protein [Guyparkeria halophila]WQH15293.1 MotA/TolQ/ExbB proton channel family protein [Guyparkeria halophila]
MNPSTLLGMFSGLAIVVAAIGLSAEDPANFLNLPGLLLVVGGTVAATLVSYPLHEVLRVFRVFGIVLKNERLYAERDINELVEVSKLKFQGQISRADEKLNRIKNPFLRSGMQMVLDGASSEDLITLLQWRIARMRARERAEAQIFRTMATFAPAFGMLGTLLGLINMLSAMDADQFGAIGTNMALALITTLYGILLSNMLFKPIALKLERRTEQRVMLMNMMVEGVLLMQEERSPAFIRETLGSFLAQSEDELRDGDRQRSRSKGRSGGRSASPRRRPRQASE